jgi:hypothetical protein
VQARTPPVSPAGVSAGSSAECTSTAAPFDPTISIGADCGCGGADPRAIETERLDQAILDRTGAVEP